MNARLDRAQPYAVGLFRIVTGLLFASRTSASPGCRDDTRPETVTA